jgi:hypothetical protein
LLVCAVQPNNCSTWAIRNFKCLEHIHGYL